MSEIYLAGGCFWGVEHYFSLVTGVSETQAGYANSRYATPSYEQVCTGETEAVEAVRVGYDHEHTPLVFILDLFFKIIDPISISQLDGDTGTQYRTGIYYTDESDRAVIEHVLRLLEKQLGGVPAIECLPLANFYPAEEYHQHYLEKNPEGYCHISPGLFEYARNAKHAGS